MVNTEIWLIIFFAAKKGEALHSQQKQDGELTVAQIMKSLLQKKHMHIVISLRSLLRRDGSWLNSVLMGRSFIYSGL